MNQSIDKKETIQEYQYDNKLNRDDNLWKCVKKRRLKTNAQNQNLKFKMQEKKPSRERHLYFYPRKLDHHWPAVALLYKRDPQPR